MIHAKSSTRQHTAHPLQLNAAHVSVCDVPQTTILDWLIARYPTAKRQTLRRMVEDRRVQVNGQRARSVKQTISDGDDVRVDDRPQRHEKPAPTLPFPIIFEDADVLVIDKPAGLLTSTVPREPRPTALAM